MIFQVEHIKSPWLIVIVRAIDKHEAQRIGADEIGTYIPKPNLSDIKVHEMNPDGKSEVLLVDAS